MPIPTTLTLSGDQLLAYGALLGRSGKVIESEVSGSSMGSSLPPGSRIRIRTLPDPAYRQGQVIAFVSGNAVFAHRIISCSRQGVLTRGDNRSWCDLPLPWCGILGLVTESQINGEWRPLSDHAPCESRRGHVERSIETLQRVSLKIDIRLARFVSRTVMSVARWRQRLMRKDVHPGGDAE